MPRAGRVVFLGAGALLLLCGLSVAGCARAVGPVQAYSKEFIIEQKAGETAEKIPQKRWYLENDFVRLAVTDDPGGAVVEFLNKQTGVNHVAGDVWSRTVDGKVEKHVKWGWTEAISDDAEDPVEKQMSCQSYRIEMLKGENGARTLKATGSTAEQQVERWMTLRPENGELLVKVKLTNISNHSRRLWIRWHPYCYASSDKFGDSGCVLAPGEGSQVRKIRIGWGWDHWFRVVEPYWMAADFKTGEGLFITFEKEKQPILTTWTDYGRRGPSKGALTLEPFPAPEMYKSGESIDLSCTYFSFGKDTKPEDIPLGLVSDKGEQSRAQKFLQNAKPVDHLALLNSYTYSDSIQFSWRHRRRDLLGLRDWGFSDCAIIGFPLQGVPARVRMTGGVFDNAPQIKGFPAAPELRFLITIIGSDGVELYRNSQQYAVTPGVLGLNMFDRELPIPTMGMPDGQYTLRVEAIDPISNKPFHSHQMDVVVFGKRMEAEKEKLAQELEHGETARPFVAALADQAEVKIESGRVVVPIGVEDGGNVKREGFPVRLGVPFPEGVFKSDAPARLLGPDGKPVPAQFQVMNVWPDKSLKWLMADFPASCAADGFAFYRLEVGRGVASEPAAPDLIRDKEDALEVNTGALIVRYDKKNLTAFGEALLNGERVMAPSKPEDAWWQGPGQDETYTLQFTGDAVDGLKPGIYVEKNGPLNAIVRLLGWYLDKNGKRVAIGELRIEANRGRPTLSMWHRVTFAGSPWRDQIKSYGIKLRFVPEEAGVTTYELDGRNLEVAGVASLYQKAADSAEVKADGKMAARGKTSTGAVAIGAKTPALVYARDFWQMYPKKLVFTPKTGELEMDYWPAEAPTHSFAPVEEFWIPSSSDSQACGTGASRVQEIVIDFSKSVAAAQARAVYGEPVVACTPPKWVRQTNVLNNLHPCDPKACPDVEQFLSTVTDYFERNRQFFQWYGHWNYGTIHNIFEEELYQWLVVGRYANIGNEEDIVQAPWLLYFRSGDRKYLNFARIWTRHLMEVQTIRWSETYPEFIGMSRRHNFIAWQGGGDFGHTMVCPWLEYYHATGYTPAWEMALLTAKSMQNTRSGTWRYIINPLIGNVRMYLETGDLQYKAVADRIWKDLMAPDRGDWFTTTHGSRLPFWYARFNPEVMEYWKKWSREGRMVKGKPNLEFDYLDSYGPLGDMTGDDWYAHRARTFFDRIRSTYTGQLMGVNPVYRGMVSPTVTQFTIGYLRTLPYAMEQIAKSKQLFPADYYNFKQIKEVVIKKEKDADFTLWTSGQDPKSIKIAGPDGKPARTSVETLFDAGKGKFFKITVKADGQTGFYRMPTWQVAYLSCSLKTIAVRSGNALQCAAGAPVYVRSDDLGAGTVRIIMQGRLGNSFELFDGDKRCFTQTYVRPGSDAVGIEQSFAVPAGKLLRVGDKIGVTFPDLAEIPLYLNAEGVFDLPPADK